VQRLFRYCLTFTLLIALHLLVQAECDSTFLGNDINVCEGQTVILNAGEGFVSYHWSNGSTGQSIEVNESGLYWCTVEYVDSVNLVINGDFSEGNGGFQSDYTYNPTSVYSEGTYAITNNPTAVHPDFASCSDHTSGTGKMMVVNGAPYPDQNVWFQSLPVTPNTDYHYSGWFTSVHPTNPAVLQLSINGESIQEINLSNATCLWQNFYNVWNSGSNTTVELQIVNQNIVMSGNDFAIDDIHLFEACILTDTVQVIFYPKPVINLGQDTTFCQGDSLILFAGNYPSYVWQNGSEAPWLIVTESGQYWVSVLNNYGCSASDTINIEVLPLPEIELGNDTTLCEGESLTLVPGNGFSNYLWQDNSTQPTYSVSAAGTYWVTVSNESNCSVTDTIHILFDAWPEIDLGDDISICEGESLTLSPGPGFLSYHWQDNSTDTSYTVDETGLYWVTVTNQCAENSDSIYVTVNPLPQPDLGADTVICNGTVLTLQTTSLYTEYLWQDNSILPFFDVSSTGFYSIEVTNNFGCSNSDEVFVDVSSPEVELGADLQECEGDTVVFDAGPGFQSYNWQDGYNGQFYTATKSGTYSVLVSDQHNCTAEDAVKVVYLQKPLAELGPDLKVCAGDTLILTAPLGAYIYYWNGEPGEQNFYVTKSGNYNLSVVNACDSVSDEININIETINPVNLGEDIIAYPGETVLLDAGQGYTSYLWQDGSQNQQIEITDNNAGIYSVDVFKGPCKSSDTVNVEFFEVWVPAIITPNGDGINDVFHPDPGKWQGIRENHMLIFNRWGEKVWESTHFEDGWDGKRDGKVVADGTYFWILDVTYSDQNIHKILKGNLTVLGGY